MLSTGLLRQGVREWITADRLEINLEQTAGEVDITGKVAKVGVYAIFVPNDPTLFVRQTDVDDNMMLCASTDYVSVRDDYAARAR